jgi:hypothetical protein
MFYLDLIFSRTNSRIYCLKLSERSASLQLSTSRLTHWRKKGCDSTKPHKEFGRASWLSWSLSRGPAGCMGSTCWKEVTEWLKASGIAIELVWVRRLCFRVCLRSISRENLDWWLKVMLTLCTSFLVWTWVSVQSGRRNDSETEKNDKLWVFYPNNGTKAKWHSKLQINRKIQYNQSQSIIFLWKSTQTPIKCL